MRGKILLLAFFVAMNSACPGLFATEGEQNSESTEQSGGIAKQEPAPKAEIPKFLEGLKLEGQWFFNYTNGEKKGEDVNLFQLKRGYVTIKKELTDRFSVRVTQDVSVDQEGDGLGDIEIRLKYGYLKFSANDFGIFTDPYFEFGVVHRPWIDFEQSINRYRVQGKMFLEKTGIISSADYGLTFISGFGGTIDKKFQKNVNKKNPGRWGSIALGVYNGGGYHAIENNTSKTFETRLTLRPLPDVLPGLQFSYTNGLGKGNTADEPDWNLEAGFVSYESSHYVLSGQYITSVGNESGGAIDETGKSIDQSGYSFFGEVMTPQKWFSLFGRYDTFDQKFPGDTKQKKNYVVGVAYNFAPGCKILFDYDLIDVIDSDTKDEKYAALSVEFAY